MIYLFLFVVQLQSILWQVAESVTTFKLPIVKDGCQETCGDIRIPYPFGIGPNCYHNNSYEIFCNDSFTPHKSFLLPFNVEVLDIDWNGRNDSDPSYSSILQTIRINTVPLNLCANGRHSSINFTHTPFSFSSKNEIIVEGCPGRVELTDSRGQVMIEYHCEGIKGSQCDCESLYPVDQVSTLDYYELSYVGNSMTSKNNNHPKPCNISAALALTDPEGQKDFQAFFPTLLNWDFACSGDARSDGNYDCQCEDSFLGNPYLPHGCRKISAHDHCVFEYDGWTCYNSRRPRSGEILGYSISTGVLLLLLVGYVLSRVVRRTLVRKKKARFFKRNGGLLLHQRINSAEGPGIEKTKIFTITELEKATDNFNKNRILGQGGQGTVYKGMLEDGGIVAIKKSTLIDEDQLAQFINEVVLLSQINHRNVVKLHGCCLETEVPLLVYEFIPNGTLYEHIQNPSEDFQVTWNMRLQIAAESAGAIAYLHSSSSTPIYHRDIKSANILLDDKYRAKVSDFGTSRAITIDQTHVTTRVQGTFGYLDPEYFQSNQFNEKSDVYSFGVVLVELLTGRRPIHPTQSGEWISLASEFICHMESSRLLEILDSRVYEEGKREDFTSVANLARQCLRLSAKRRPTMKEVARVLEDIRSPHNAANATRHNFGDDKQVVHKIRAVPEI